MSQLDEFNALAQSGQELSRETLWPAQILFGTDSAAVAGSMGFPASSDPRLVAGGFSLEGEATFRVLASLLPTPPELGSPVRWKRPTDTDWQGPLTIIRITAEHSAWRMEAGTPPQ